MAGDGAPATARGGPERTRDATAAAAAAVTAAAAATAPNAPAPTPAPASASPRSSARDSRVRQAMPFYQPIVGGPGMGDPMKSAAAKAAYARALGPRRCRT